MTVTQDAGNLLARMARDRGFRRFDGIDVLDLTDLPAHR